MLLIVSPTEFQEVSFNTICVFIERMTRSLISTGDASESLPWVLASVF